VASSSPGGCAGKIAKVPDKAGQRASVLVTASGNEADLGGRGEKSGMNRDGMISIPKEDALPAGDLFRLLDIGRCRTGRPRFSSLRPPATQNRDYHEILQKSIGDKSFVIGIPADFFIDSEGAFPYIFSLHKQPKEEFSMSTVNTIATEDRYMPAFYHKLPVSIERGEGVTVWDEEGNRYLDFTSGWGVTCLGHAHPVIIGALSEQSGKILQGPAAGVTYSPVRARLLTLLASILPANLTRIFFSNSGAESNDATIKLARKVTGRGNIVSALQGFHGRMTSTAAVMNKSAGQAQSASAPPGSRFVPYGDLAALEAALDSRVAAVLLEPIQSEGGVRIPPDSYLEEAGRLCRANGSLLIIDEVTTGFCRTGPMFAIDPLKVEADFITMAKGIAGGFPFGAFALSEEVAGRLGYGDHGGTYCGNPLGCAVAHAVISHLLEADISANVSEMGALALDRAGRWRETWPESITEIRGRGLLLAVEFATEATAARIADACLAQRLFVRQTLGNMIRIFPALNIRREEMEEGLAILEKAIAGAVQDG